MGQKRRRFREDFDQGAVRPAPDDRCGGPRRGGVRLLEGCGRPAGHFHEVSLMAKYVKLLNTILLRAI